MVSGATPKWRDIGIELVNEDEIRTIGLNYVNNIRGCCIAMFTYWLASDTEATWKRLLETLRSSAVCLNALARNVEEGKYVTAM